MFKFNLLLFLKLTFVTFASAQSCDSMFNRINVAILKAEQYIDNVLYNNFDKKAKYIEAYIVYPVIKRSYYKNLKTTDTAIVKKIDDFNKVIWCFNGNCFNNNTAFLNKSELLDKINSNDLNSNTLRESVCMLCNKYNLDTLAIIKILDYSDTTAFYSNENSNNYALLHKALQVYNLHYLKCIPNNLYDRYKSSLIDTIYNSFILKYDTNIHFDEKGYDLFTEAILMLSLLDEKVNLSDHYYEKLLMNQLKNGAWPLVEKSNNVNQHTTILSYWSLLVLRNKLNNLFQQGK